MLERDQTYLILFKSASTYHLHPRMYTQAPHTCTTHMHHTHAPHTCTTHMHHTCTTHMHHTHAPHTCTTHMHHTHAPHTCTTHMHHTHAPHTCTTHTHHTHAPHTHAPHHERIPEYVFLFCYLLTTVCTTEELQTLKSERPLRLNTYTTQ